MRYLLFALIGLLLPHSSNSQTIDLKNEYWSRYTGPDIGVSFQHYHFLENGTYVYDMGYSGGSYFKFSSSGKYKYNKSTNEIRLDRKKSDKINGKKQPLGKSFINLISYTDTTVTIQYPKDTNTYTFDRQIGNIADQNWHFTTGERENKWTHMLTIQHFGQLIYEAENNHQSITQLRYVCSYHFVDNVLYLDIRSKQILFTGTPRVDTVFRFAPNLQTFIRVNLAKRQINELDLMDLITDNISHKSWSFFNNNFVPKNSFPLSNNGDWVVFQSSEDKRKRDNDDE